MASVVFKLFLLILPFWRWILAAAVLFVLSVPFRLWLGFLRPNTFGVNGLSPAEVSNPVDVTVDPGRVRRLDPRTGRSPKRMSGLQQWLGMMDGRPAVVASTLPLVVVALIDELDALVSLRFDPSQVPDAAALRVGDRLLCAAGYQWVSNASRVREVAPDLIEGPGSSRQFDNVVPIVVDFLVDDRGACERGRARIEGSEWQALGERLSAWDRGAVPPRDGRPSRCHLPSVRRLAWLWRLTKSVGRNDELHPPKGASAAETRP